MKGICTDSVVSKQYSSGVTSLTKKLAKMLLLVRVYNQQSLSAAFSPQLSRVPASMHSPSCHPLARFVNARDCHELGRGNGHLIQRNVAFAPSLRSSDTALYLQPDGNDASQINDDKKNGTDKSFSLPSLGDLAMSGLLRAAMMFSERNIFSISYFEGYNLNFKISQEEANSLLPDVFTPLKLKILESEGAEQYYLSWYFAKMGAGESVGRIDLFTYALDKDNKKCLYFLSSIMGIPPWVQNVPIFKKSYEDVMDYLAQDSETGLPSYPHYYTNDIEANKDGFSVSYKDTKVEVKSREPIATDQKLSRDFVLANSRIYRNEHDINENFFNDGFMDADVETWNPEKVEIRNIENLHPSLNPDNLESVQYYGDEHNEIRWYFEIGKRKD